MIWGVVIIGGLLLAAAVFAGFMQNSNLLKFPPVDPIRLAFVIGGTAVASILSLIALYSVIVRGHLAPFVSVMALIAFGLSAYLIMAPGIGEMKHARGVITVIFSVGTISIALILVMAVLFSKWSGSDSQHLTERFESAKQVLTMLLGILGTIVGFYFGSTTDDAAATFSARVLASDLTPTAGDSLTVTVLFEGGKPPFLYSLEFDDSEIEDITNQKTETRSVQHVVSLDKVNKPKELGVTLTVTDDAGDETTYYRKPGWVTMQDSAEPENESLDDKPIPELGST